MRSGNSVSHNSYLLKTTGTLIAISWVVIMLLRTLSIRLPTKSLIFFGGGGVGVKGPSGVFFLLNHKSAVVR